MSTRTKSPAIALWSLVIAATSVSGVSAAAVPLPKVSPQTEAQADTPSSATSSPAIKRHLSCCTRVQLIPRSAPGKNADQELTAHARRAYSYLDSSDYTNALVEANQAVHSFPQNALSHYLVGSALMALADFPEATKAFEESVKLDSTSADAQFMLAQAYRLRGKYPEALEHYNRALAEKPDWAAAQAMVGECYRMQGHDWRMTAECHKAMQLEPTLPLPHTIMADGHLMQGRNGACMDEYKKALELAPEDPYVHFRYGQALSALECLPEAEAELQKALELDATYEDAAMVLAGVFCKQKKMTQALSFAHKAVGLAPNDADTHVALAQIFTEARDHEGAVREYRLARSLKPRSLRIQRDLALALAETHRLDEAIVEMSLVSHALPLDEDIRLQLGALLQLKKKERAEKGPHQL